MLGIGSGGVQSQYDRLFIGCTAVDAPVDPDVVHVNVNPEDMRFPAVGPRILIDGRAIPLPDQFFRHGEGSHIPYDRSLIPALLHDLYRTLRPGGTLRYAPSTNVLDVIRLLQREGFVGVRIVKPAPRTHYRGKTTLPTQVIEATKP